MVPLDVIACATSASRACLYARKGLPKVKDGHPIEDT